MVIQPISSANPYRWIKEGRWKEIFDDWEVEGRPNDKPPGVANLAPPMKHRKLHIYSSNHSDSL